MIFNNFLNETPLSSVLKTARTIAGSGYFHMFTHAGFDAFKVFLFFKKAF